jgi:NADPH:quinone reductase-like Zn-dependent oxidoreductase
MTMNFYFLIRISPEGVDIILDCLCGDDCNRGYGLLKPMGKYILFGSSNVVTGETKSFFSVARSVSLCEF